MTLTPEQLKAERAAFIEEHGAEPESMIPGVWLAWIARAKRSMDTYNNLPDEALPELPDDGELESWRKAADDLLRNNPHNLTGPQVRRTAHLLQNAYLFANQMRAYASAAIAAEREKGAGDRKDALGALLEQIDRAKFTDELGHSLQMSVAYIRAKELL